MVDKAVLKNIPLFKNLDNKELDVIAKIVKEEAYPSEEIIFSENMQGGRLFIIKKGTVKISKTLREGERQNLNILKENEFFGECSFIDSRPHSATAETLKNTDLFIIEKSDFDKLEETNPMCGYKVLRTLTLTINGILRQMDEKFIDMVKYVWEYGSKS
ncbi:MAG: cyclic nucleotide-binding domain-containing protein [bacterium]|nr:cyclic nucleotide-binding domain-containing protein [bacterium]